MALADLTGHMPLPPRWALGYHQCRYSYAPAAEVPRIADELRARHIPCDVLWLDIDYMDGNRSFTFDPRGFPDPAGMNARLHAQGFHTVWIIDPGIKAEPGYCVYDQGTAGDALGPGPPAAPTPRPGLARRLRLPRLHPRRHAALVGRALRRICWRSGVDGIWNDMNEPAVFDVDSKTMPLDQPPPRRTTSSAGRACTRATTTSTAC